MLYIENNSNIKKNSNGREEFITYSKAIAAVFVILSHTLAGMDINKELLDRILVFFYITHVPTFMIISGYLYSKYTINNTLKYRLLKLSNFIACFFIYVAVLTLLRSSTHYLMRTESTIYDDFILSFHNMWYFLVLSISILIYELTHYFTRIAKCAFGLLFLVSIVFCIFMIPPIGKLLVYVLIFFEGTGIVFNSRSIKFYMAIDFLLLFVFVFCGHFVRMSSEGSRGLELLTLMIITALGASLIPSVVSFILNNYNRKLARNNNFTVSNSDLMKIVNKSCVYICQHSQIFYFSQFIVIAIIEILRKVERFGYSVIDALLYSMMCFGISIIISVTTDRNKLVRKVLCKPFL